jgi:cation diffusion facilitator family transporter
MSDRPIIGRTFEYPPEQARQREKAKRLSWLSIGLLCTAGTFVFFAVGQSEAMKTAWITDFLTAVPPASLLLAMRFELRSPNRRYPYGYTRAIGIAFLVTSGVLSLIGLYLFFESMMKLLMQQRPPIGTMELFGHQLWQGWVMIVALAYSLVCGLTIGLLKKPVAEALSDKALNAEATMNRDEWMSEGAAILGILLVGLGYWWGDATAAAFISLEMVHDGWLNLRLVIGDLMDESPSKMGTHELEAITDRVRGAVEQMDGVADAAARLREHGRVLTGELYVVLENDGGVADRVDRIARDVHEIDWRLHEITVMPVKTIRSTEPPSA